MTTLLAPSHNRVGKVNLMSNNNQTVLEKKIAEALLAEEISESSVLATLIKEVESAAAGADQAVEAARQRAFDPAVLDPGARGAVHDAEYLSQRLRAAVPRLQARLAEAEAVEHYARRRAEHARLAHERDELGREFQTDGREMAERLADLYARMASKDKELAAFNAAARAGESLYLTSVEEAAGKHSFDRDNPSIVKTTVLPGLWPPMEVPLAAILADMSAPVYDTRQFSGRWHEVLAEENASRESERRRWTEQEAQSQAASRRKYEESLLQR
jgi:hypothetical protein